MSIKENLKKEWFVWPILLAPFVVSIFLWDQLPEEVPTHFNAKGEADDWGPKWINAFLLPGIGAATYLLLLFLPLIDPKKKISNAQKPISAIRIFTSIFFVVIYALVMTTSMNIEVNISQYVYLGVGVLFVIIGNYMNSVKPNYFIGLRTPWTLENSEVWKRTHRLGSKLWVVGGLLLMGAPFIIPIDFISGFTVGLVVVLAGVPFVYSYLIFKKMDLSSQNNEEG